MAEEVREKLLEPFERGDVSYSGRIEGNGFGMALVKNIIDIMQGEIYVDSTIGEGTTIRTILHLKKSVEVEKQDDKAKKYLIQLACSKENAFFWQRTTN